MCSSHAVECVLRGRVLNLVLQVLPRGFSVEAGIFFVGDGTDESRISGPSTMWGFCGFYVPRLCFFYNFSLSFSLNRILF